MRARRSPDFQSVSSSIGHARSSSATTSMAPASGASACSIASEIMFSRSVTAANDEIVSNWEMISENPPSTWANAMAD